MVQNKLARQENEQQVMSVGDLLTVREVAHRLRVDDTTVRRWIKAGALEAVLLPHRGKRCGYRIKKVTLDTLVNEGSLPA
ncbi:MAG TPA: helix-turn-helix domain-containing protein [Ktedonobacteraceae bacterium]|jgi:excisionase family DNA binding protein|nr:helix-turn-helix domain-containing protein [Ktedonobacteraceae bacterium]